MTKLHWETEPLSTSVNFLDLTISLLPDNTIITKTYQKKENLFLYIPPQSAHPPGMIKSLIYSLTRTYYIQNTNLNDFKHTLSNFYQRLINRGYSRTTIHPLFQTSIQKIISDPTVNKLRTHKDKNTPTLQPSTSTNLPDNNTLFLHLEYHPQDISRQRIKNFYEPAFNTPDDNNQSFSLGIQNRDGDTMKISEVTGLLKTKKPT